MNKSCSFYIAFVDSALSSQDTGTRGTLLKARPLLTVTVALALLRAKMQSPLNHPPVSTQGSPCCASNFPLIHSPPATPLLAVPGVCQACLRVRASALASSSAWKVLPHSPHDLTAHSLTSFGLQQQESASHHSIK